MFFPNPHPELLKMRALEWYNCEEPELVEIRRKVALIYREFNKTEEDPASLARRMQIYSLLFGSIGENLNIMPPFYCDYGKYISFGKSVFLNFGCMILDGSDVTIGDNTMFGPNCHIYTVYHPMEPGLRNQGLQKHKPVKIGRNVWFGGGVTVLAGVEVGDNCVIGAGSLVTKSIPEASFACGNPCKVVRKIKVNDITAKL